MDAFTYGVLTYNHENIVKETLESIKYQKIRYGELIAVKLIIVDDASIDKTDEVIKEWIIENKHLFSDILFICNTENKGTVANYCTILNEIDNEDFKIIAGDDLIGRDNLFPEYENIDSKKIKTYFRLILKNGVVLYNEDVLVDFYYHQKYAKNRLYHLRNFRRGSYFHTPSTIHNKQLYINAKCEKNLVGFRIFEDDPIWYSMLKNEKELDVEFLGKGIVLYRVHDKSVSNSPNPEFEMELLKLRQKYYDDAKGFEKIYFAFRKGKNIPKYLRIDKYVDKILHIYRKCKCINDSDYRMLKKKIEDQVEREQEYYDTIKTLAN